MGHHHYSARRHPEFVVLEIGDGIGALIIHADAEMHGAEIEISPAPRRLAPQPQGGTGAQHRRAARRSLPCSTGSRPARTRCGCEASRAPAG